ncbi:MAG: anti-sigma F factor [Clostridiales bacterium]|nr:anti-sigma F factor [Clostridiales bacterium]
MKILNEMKLTIPSKSQNEGFSRTAIAAFVAQLDPTVQEISEIKTAVSEAVTNCIVHAYKNTMGNIDIVARILSENKIYIRIKDKGCGIEDIKQAREALFTTSPDEERAGLGFSVMESFMDTLRVTSRIGKGTTVVMIKSLKTKSDFYEK